LLILLEIKFQKMKKGKLLKNIGFVLMIGSLAFMALSYIQGKGMNPVLIGLVGICVGNILTYFGNKKIAEEKNSNNLTS